MELRSHLSPAAIGALFNGIMVAAGGLVYQTSLDLVEFAPSGSDVFNPVTTGFEGTVYPGAGVSGAVTPASFFTSFIGRSTGGRRARIYLYGVNTTATDYRFLPGENANVDAVIGVLQGSGSDLRAIDDIPPIWKSYANAGVSAHWQKALRP
jgi:hypothetical protein